MKKFAIAGFLALASTTWATAGTVFSAPSLSDDNSGAFIAGATSGAVGNTFTINFPNFSQSDFGSFDASFVGLGLIVTGDTNFIELDYLVTGIFTGLGDASFSHTANDGTTANGTINADLSSRSGVINDFTPSTTLNITSSFNLDDMGDSAAVTQVQFTVVQSAGTPEPATLSLAAAGLLAALALARKRRA